MITVDDAKNFLIGTFYISLSLLVILAVVFCLAKLIQWFRDDFRY